MTLFLPAAQPSGLWIAKVPALLDTLLMNLAVVAVVAVVAVGWDNCPNPLPNLT